MPLAPSAQTAALRHVWEDADSYTMILLAVFLDRYGTEAITWDPTTILLEIQDDFRVTLPQLVFDRLMVGINLLTSDAFYKSLPDFVDFCIVLSGHEAHSWEPADALELAWGLTEALLIDPPEEDEPLSDEIRAYIGAVLDDEGIVNPPDLLRLGMRDHAPAGGTPDEYSDDPGMYSAIYKAQSSKTDDINQMLKTHLRQLLEQLQSLPLTTGDATAGVRQMLGQLRS